MCAPDVKVACQEAIGSRVCIERAAIVDDAPVLFTSIISGFKGFGLDGFIFANVWTSGSLQCGFLLAWTRDAAVLSIVLLQGVRRPCGAHAL